MKPDRDVVYGWKDHRGVITALIVGYGGEHWSLCPDADLPPGQWPPLPAADGDVFAAALEPHLAAGNVVDLTPVLATTQGYLFWVPAGEESGVFAVAFPPPPEYGWMPGPGRFAYCPARRAGRPVPPLDDLLADPRRVDVGPRLAPA